VKKIAFPLVIAAAGAVAEVREPPAEDTVVRYERQMSKIVEEVYVTARRREEKLQETPVAVTAMSADSLAEAGIAAITDLQGAVPSLQFGESGSKTPAIFIRGIGQREATSVLDPGVGVYLNGIFIARQDTQLLDTVDTQSIQVLRGPQGTLFGKNNTGGAILVGTKQADFEKLNGSIDLRVGGYGRRDAKLAGNIPLVEGRSGVRFAVNSTRLDGYFENSDGALFGDEDRLAISARWQSDLTDNIRSDVFFYWSKQKELSSGITCLFQNPEANIATLRYPNQPDFKEVCERSESLARKRKLDLTTKHSEISMESRMVALTLEWDLAEELVVKSISAASWQDGIARNDDQDGTSGTILDSGTESLNRTLAADGKSVPEEERWQFSQELQISGESFGGRLNYTAGFFASIEEINNNNFSQLVGKKGLAGIRPSIACDAINLGAVCGLLDDDFVLPLATFFATRSDLENTSWAAFTQATYDFNDYLQLTLGGRYTVEERHRDLSVLDVDYQEYGRRIGALYIEPAGIYSPMLMSQFNSLGEDTPDLPVIVREDVDSQGAEWNNFTPSATLSFTAPERWRSNQGLDSFMAYLTYSEGFKAGGFEPKGDELVPFDPEEATNVEVGVKLDALNSQLRFNAAAYYMDYENIQVRVAEQGEKISDLYLYLSNAGQAKVQGVEFETTLALDNWYVQANYSYTDAKYNEFLTPIVIPLEGERTVDRSAEDFGLVPEHSGGMSVSYHWMSSIGVVVPRLSVSYRSELFTGIDYKAVEYSNSYIDEVWLWDFRLNWLPSESIGVIAYVKNLTDEVYYRSGFAVSALLGGASYVQGSPRQAGVELSWRF
jgi:iron complex outermembrane receptor protein